MVSTAAAGSLILLGAGLAVGGLYAVGELGGDAPPPAPTLADVPVVCRIVPLGQGDEGGEARSRECLGAVGAVQPPKLDLRPCVPGAERAWLEVDRNSLGLAVYECTGGFK